MQALVLALLPSCGSAPSTPQVVATRGAGGSATPPATHEDQAEHRALARAQLTHEGVLVSAASGVFEGSGPVVDHVVVREPGPVRRATITTGAEARARFERPGLTAAFFRGEPLPTAP